MNEAMDWQELEESIQRRRHARRRVQLPAQLTWRGQQFAARIENISPGGALLHVQLPPGADDVVAEIELANKKAVRVHAKVRWQRPSGVGIEFGEFLAPFDSLESMGS
jgi:PilZ domain